MGNWHSRLEMVTVRMALKLGSMPEGSVTGGWPSARLAASVDNFIPAPIW
jgi:hypothetical protein